MRNPRRVESRPYSSRSLSGGCCCCWTTLPAAAASSMYCIARAVRTSAKSWSPFSCALIAIASNWPGIASALRWPFQDSHVRPSGAPITLSGYETNQGRKIGSSLLRYRGSAAPTSVTMVRRAQVLRPPPSSKASSRVPWHPTRGSPSALTDNVREPVSSILQGYLIDRSTGRAKVTEIAPLELRCNRLARRARKTATRQISRRQGRHLLLTHEPGFHGAARALALALAPPQPRSASRHQAMSRRCSAITSLTNARGMPMIIAIISTGLPWA